ncbi:hypothetical protein R50073_49700 (plasmid) [Maricurvus nonylphenolicus]|uniref:DsbA family protein n=1 Tax=Maricurvus nonylphenolicus TaxID=1008307 RepID=UPI0036F3C6CC
MKQYLQKAMNIKTAIAISVLALAVAILAVYMSINNAAQIGDATTPVTIQQLVDADKKAFDAYVKDQIDGYVAAQKQKKIDRKYDAYSDALERTRTGKHIYGEEDARFTLVEFSDLECPFCKRFHSVPKEVVDASSGRVNWEWKHLPLPSHNPVASVEAQASECVAEIKGNRAFWVYIHQVFDETKGNGQGAGDLINLASNIGVDPEEFADCMKEGRHSEKIAKDLQLATQMNVNSTPVTFVIDNHTGKQVMLRGMRKPESIATTIQRLLKEQQLEKDLAAMKE